MMKTILRYLFIALCLSGSVSTSKATHIAALDLGLTCISGNDYMVTFVLYRDCSGISAPTSVNLSLTCTSNPALNFTINALPNAASGQEVAVTCSANPTKCNGGFLYGIQEYIYQVQVTLQPCNEWVVSWTTCCRNPSNTIINATSTSAYIEARLNTLLAPGASTPILTNFPSLILCSNTLNCQNPGAVDVDGDSIAYAMVTPFNTNATSYVNWLPPHSATQPLPSSPPVSLNLNNGELCISPTMNIISPMAIRFQKWRNIGGVPTLIGVTYRDLQVNSISCNSNMPILTGMDTTLSHGFNTTDTLFFDEVCAGSPVQFAIWGHDPDTFNPANLGNPEQFSIFWNQGIQGANFSPIYQSTDSAYALFSWTPTPLHAGLTHCFVATIRDKTCPYFLSRQYTYCLKVKPGLNVNIGNDVILCSGGSHMFQAIADSITSIYQWFVNGTATGVPTTNPSFTFNASGWPSGTHLVSVLTNTNNPGQICPGVDFAMVEIIPDPNPNLGNDTLIGFWETLMLNAGLYDHYSWSTGDTSQIIHVDSTGHGANYKLIWVQVTDSLGCVGSDTIIIGFVSNPGIEEPKQSGTITVYPNPSDGHFDIILSQFSQKKMVIELYDNHGKRVLSDQITPDSETHNHSINAGNLSKGLYMLILTPEGQPPITQKIIIQQQP